MAAPQDYFQRIDLTNASGGGNTLLNRTGDNVREDFFDAIYNIAPVDTPFMSGVGRETCKDVFSSWQQDDLAEPNSANAAKDGADIGADSSSRARRVGNTCQISNKSLIVTGRADEVDKAGRSSEMAYQLAKSSKALKRDMEAILTGAQAAVADADGNTASKLGGLAACFRAATASTQEVTSALVGAGTGALGGVGAAGIPTAPVAGTARALSETLLQTAIRNAYINGGNPDTIMVTPTIKQTLSAYLFSSSARVAALYSEIGQGTRSGQTAQASVDIYVSDFGTLKIVPSRYMGYNTSTHTADNTRLYALDMTLWAVGYLRKFQTVDVARSGDASKKLLLVDYTLVYKQEMGSGAVFDIDPAAPMVA